MDMTEKPGRSIAGKVALVTGGSRGIGKGIVRRLASDGAAVAFTYSSSEEKAKRLASEIEAARSKRIAPLPRTFAQQLIKSQKSWVNCIFSSTMPEL
jgi:NAD(P)-dependent dehydrogenase (short-subunit alcohol dehydrogenase family)